MTSHLALPKAFNVKKDIRGHMGGGGAAAPAAKVYTEAEKNDAMLNGGECEACQ